MRIDQMYYGFSGISDLKIFAFFGTKTEKKFGWEGMTNCRVPCTLFQDIVDKVVLSNVVLWGSRDNTPC